MEFQCIRVKVERNIQNTNEYYSINKLKIIKEINEYNKYIEVVNYLFEIHIKSIKLNECTSI